MNECVYDEPDCETCSLKGLCREDLPTRSFSKLVQEAFEDEE